MTRPGALLAAALVTSLTAAPQERGTGLTGAPAIAGVYDAILDARFDAVPALRARACPPAPLEACEVLDAVAIWWRIQMDPRATTLDARFAAAVEKAIASTNAWTAREPDRAEAWFYLGGAYGARVQWRALRGQRLAAARDGARIKAALERARALEPTLWDAYFGLGLYHYYADVAPRLFRMLRWVLLLPGGDREQGLAEMLKAREMGQLLRSEADYQLHVIYVWYEKQPKRALDLLGELQERHPRNPHFRQAAAEILDFYLDDTEASLRAWTGLLEDAERGEVELAAMAAASARLGIASQLHQLGRGEAALPHLDAVIVSSPPAPADAVARARRLRAQILDARRR